MKPFFYLLASASLLLLGSCQNELDSPLDLELTFVVTDEQGKPIDNATAYFSLDQSAQDIADLIQVQGPGIRTQLVQSTSAQGRFSVYPVMDFPDIEEQTEIHFFIRSEDQDPVSGVVPDNLTTTRSFFLKNIKPRAREVEVVLK